MSKQTTLSRDPPIILDATCSYARKWPKHASIRIDIRPETKPDIVMDAKNIEFPNGWFDEIYCDPPHLHRNGPHKTEKQKRRLLGRKSPGFWERYGFWKTKDEWFDFVEKTNIEFHRVLKSNGILHYKITESTIINYDEFISKMTNFTEIVNVWDYSKSNFTKGNIVQYITFRRNTVQTRSQSK